MIPIYPIPNFVTGGINERQETVRIKEKEEEDERATIKKEIRGRRRWQKGGGRRRRKRSEKKYEKGRWKNHKKPESN